uniref:SH3 domain-containing protein n=1 Tax=Steinernema glaseri TaxID=37863 RepID=A0A1I7Z3E2_9BILA
MAKAQGGKRLSFFVRDAKSPSLSSEEEVEENVECNKVVYAIHKQLVTQFHPAVKDVAEAGVNLLRAFHAIHKAADAYANTILALANSGAKAHPETVEVAGSLHQVALQMRSITDAHRKCVGKFSGIVTKTNEYSVQEKDLLKHLLTSFTKKEKGIKKFVEKGLRDPRDLQEFYRAEMKDNVLQQKFRYKFFVDKHSDWLLSYANLGHTISDILGGSDSDSESSDSDSSDEGEQQRRRPMPRTASAASARSQGSQPERPPSSILREPAGQPQKEWSRRESIGNSSISVSEKDERPKVQDHLTDNVAKDQPLQLRKNNSSFLLPLAREETKSRTSSILKVRDHPQVARHSESSITDTVVNHAEFHLGDEEVADILSDLDNATASLPVMERAETPKENIEPVETISVEVHHDHSKPVHEEVGITVFPAEEENTAPAPVVSPVPVVSPRKIDLAPAIVPVAAARNPAPAERAISQPTDNKPITARQKGPTIDDNTGDLSRTNVSKITPLSPTTLQYVKPSLQEKPKVATPPTQPHSPIQSAKKVEPTQRKLTPTASIDSRTVDWERGDRLVCTSGSANVSSGRCLTASAGQLIELLKVGTKGWIFVRNVDTLETGWFPSMYAKKAD